MLNLKIYENCKYDFSRHRKLAEQADNHRLADALMSAENVLKDAWKVQHELVEECAEYRRICGEAEDAIVPLQNEIQWLYGEKARLEAEVKKLQEALARRPVPISVTDAERRHYQGID